MKITTLMAICLLAFSPLALAGDASCECCDKHHESMAKKDHGKHLVETKDAKTCKDHHGSMHKGHDKAHAKPISGHQAMKHAGMDHCGMEHGEHMKAMEKTCSAAGDCASMCEEEAQQCEKDDCKKCCAKMDNSGQDHSGH